MRQPASQHADRAHGAADADARALRQLRWLAIAALACTITVFLFMIAASVQAVTTIDGAAVARERTQVARALAALPGGINEITLDAMAGTLDLDGARLTIEAGKRPGEIAVSAGGDRVVAWTPHRFGTSTFQVIAPMRIGAGALFILIVAGIGWRVAVVGKRLDGRRAIALHLASTDALTGLGNRLAFDEALKARSAAAEAGGPGFVLVLADLDSLKAINDACGHAAGDAALQHVGRHLREAADAWDVVARIGGDEFAVLCSGADLDAFLGEVKRRIATPLVHDGRTLTVAASFGVARSDDFPGAGRLTQAADTALYRAKRSGPGNAELAVPAFAPPRRYAA
ncbi:MAG: GGDEF domain-containing protein [Devosia nanyangense]|uniref:diguanylate cyclase n=1 Tax=Devosia nanyangense TaxID=1228055 RepID=A0A933NZT7_9HYPH|nr:GGDEF domain-containing protein [Devosia nanyangense]